MTEANSRYVVNWLEGLGYHQGVFRRGWRAEEQRTGVYVDPPHTIRHRASFFQEYDLIPNCEGLVDSWLSGSCTYDTAFSMYSRNHENCIDHEIAIVTVDEPLTPNWEPVYSELYYRQRGISPK